MKNQFEFINEDQYREYLRMHFASLAMQGYCGGEYTGQSGMPVEMIAKWSVEMAEALLKELDKPKNLNP